MTRLDYEYYLRREQQERDNAARCDDRTARVVHLEMAKRYSAMLLEIQATQPAAQAR